MKPVLKSTIVLSELRRISTASGLEWKIVENFDSDSRSCFSAFTCSVVMRAVTTVPEMPGASPSPVNCTSR